MLLQYVVVIDQTELMVSAQSFSSIQLGTRRRRDAQLLDPNSEAYAQLDPAFFDDTQPLSKVSRKGF